MHNFQTVGHKYNETMIHNFNVLATSYYDVATIYWVKDTTQKLHTCYLYTTVVSEHQKGGNYFI